MGENSGAADEQTVLATLMTEIFRTCSVVEIMHKS